jgi:hypothetical protein
MHNCKIVALGAKRHGHELLELGKVEGYGVAAKAGQSCNRALELEETCVL